MHHLWPPPDEVMTVYEGVIVHQKVAAATIIVAAFGVQSVIGEARSMKLGYASYRQLKY